MGLCGIDCAHRMNRRVGMSERRPVAAKTGAAPEVDTVGLVPPTFSLPPLQHEKLRLPGGSAWLAARCDRQAERSRPGLCACTFDLRVIRLYAMRNVRNVLFI